MAGEKNQNPPPLRVSKISLAEPHTATHARYWASMREVAGLKEGVAVVVVAHPGRVVAADPSLNPIWVRKGGGRWLSGQLTPHLNPSLLQGGSVGEGVVAGALLERTSTPEGGLHYTALLLYWSTLALWETALVIQPPKGLAT
jgi:hypothetical protein